MTRLFHRLLRRLPPGVRPRPASNDTDVRVGAAIRRLEYDFRRFTVQDFINHIIHLRDRHIVLVPYSFDRDLHGVFVRAETADYVFYNDGGHPVHKVHNILHELGHIILDHPGIPLNTVIVPAYPAHLEQDQAGRVCTLFRTVAPGNSHEEQEAEAFVRTLQREILVANRMEQLTGRSSSIDNVAKFTRSLGYHD